MDKSIPPKLKAFFVRNYSRQDADKTLREPVFIAHKRKATVFLGWKFRENLRLCRRLKCCGYVLILRKRRIPSYRLSDDVTGEQITFTWSERQQACFLGEVWN